VSGASAFAFIHSANCARTWHGARIRDADANLECGGLTPLFLRLTHGPFSIRPLQQFAFELDSSRSSASPRFEVRVCHGNKAVTSYRTPYRPCCGESRRSPPCFPGHLTIKFPGSAQ
jgi:hypothetical protein